MSYRLIQQLTHRQSTRRRVLKMFAGTLTCLATVRFGSVLATELPHLTDANPSAASLGYTEDSSSVDPARFPKHSAQQRCANCKFFQATAGQQYGPCMLYPGNAVNMNGWCGGYVAK